MSLHKFRINPPKPYAERMTETRADVRRIVRDQLSQITGQPNATMKWAHNAYMKDVVSRYRVRLEGWPLAEVPFRNLSDVPNLQKLELLLRGLRGGTIRFVHITEAQYQAMVADPSPWIGHQDAIGEEGDADDT
ncbi:hypothetical protein TRAPUB_1447 [Trametes pubescens]|uniref:Uncharacterized protein n=1 Tax=Trametes pubescens TaxID=154538 RepID=A0A1M2VJE5_TRAPU|nr:hypothetical protein TRAPUB_1447 [Trametes pubescens]